MHDLARLREAQGKSEEAKDLYARALAIRQQALGANHFKTLETRNRFIALSQIMGRHEEDQIRVDPERTRRAPGTPFFGGGIKGKMTQCAYVYLGPGQRISTVHG